MIGYQIPKHIYFLALNMLTHKQLEQHGCIPSTLATDALVLKHQAIITHSADEYSLHWNNFMQKCYIYSNQH